MYEEIGRVIDIHDGDTITVQLNSGEESRIRILGIQAMEIHPFENNTENDYYADEATSKLTEILGGIGSTVTLSAIDKNTEILNRDARHVFVDYKGEQINVAQVLLEEGYVLPFPHETENTYNELYMRLGLEAKEKNIGIWKDSDDFNIEVNFDAEGDDNLNVNGEWVKITNNSGIDTDISNWILRDSGLNFFIFPDNTIIENNESFIIYAGKGTNTSNTFYWGNSDPILDNFGDGIYLHENLDDSGNPNDDIYPISVLKGSTQFPYSTSIPDELVGKVEISANYDAVGDDNENLNGEWITVKNISSETINLKGYQIHSEPIGSDHYYFSESTSLKTGQILTLYIGSGEDSSLEKYWGKETGILANSSDRVWIDSIDGNLVDEYSWPSSSNNSKLSQDDISKLYVTLFNRAGEKEGNDYWIGTGFDQNTTIEKMLATSDSQKYFGDSLDSDQAFIEHIYKNTLNKTIEDDPSGINYWVNLLQDNSRAEVVSKLITAIDSFAPGTSNYNPNDTATVEAYNQFTNRVEVSNFTAENLDSAPTNYGQLLGFDGDLDVTGLPSTASIAKIYIEETLL